MDYTNNCTRVPFSQGTIPFGTPDELGLAPATLGLESDPVSLETYDGAALNQSRRDASDVGHDDRPITKLHHRILKCTSTSIFSTFNVRTLGPKGRFEELVECSCKLGVEVIAIQEHRFFHPDANLRYQSVSSYQLVTSSATKNASNSSVGGIGFLLSSKACDNLISVESISPRLMVLELDGNPKTTIICAYSPTNDSSEEEIDQFYTDLRSITENIPLHNFFVLSGDMNAKLGPPDVNFSYNKRTNRNGEKLLEYMEEYNLFSASNNFMKPQGQLWTFEYPSGQRAQLDYMLFRKKWKNSVKDTRSYSSFSTVGSDHRIVSSYVKLSLRASKKSKPHPMKSIDWKEVSSNQILSNEFSVAVHNRFEALSVDVELNLNNIDEIYSNLISATEEVAKEMLPKKQRGKHNKSKDSPTVKSARDHLKKLSLDYHRNPTKAKKKTLESAKKRLDESYLKAEADFIDGKIQDISSLHIGNKHHAAWKTVGELSGKCSKPTTRIKGGSAAKRMSSWHDHFKNLLGKPPKIPENGSLPMEKISDILDICTTDFTKDELKIAIKKLNSSKAFGPDNIPAIIWKDDIFHDLLLKLCNFCLINKTCPSSWRTSQIIPVPKKGDLTLVTNYRGISLLPIAAKIYNKLILNRLLPKVDPLLRKNQNGFRAGRSTLSQVLTLRRIIEEITNCNKEAVFIFVDFSKAFDSIDRSKMFEILGLYGIPEPIIEAIRVLYTNTSSTIMTPDGETEPIDIMAGILQGDTLAPFLFIMVLDYVLRKSLDLNNTKGFQLHPRKSSRHPAVHLTDADFADDIALISNSIENAQTLLNSLESAANCVGLYLNDSKTEYMCYTKSNNSIDNMIIKTVNGYILKRVNDYKYLGSFASSSEKDFNARKGMAWSACNDLHKIWTSKLAPRIKIKIFRATIEPILLYGSETWTLPVRLEKRLDGCYTRLLMRVKNLSWKKHPTLKQIYGNLTPASSLVRQRRTQFAGHCQRATNEIISSLILWKPHAEGRKGRKLTFPDVISRDTGIGSDDLKTAMEDREVWKSYVQSVVSTAVEK